jgi:chromosome segregation ATPase
MSDGFDYSSLYYAADSQAHSASRKAARAEETLADAQERLAQSTQHIQTLEESLRLANRRIWEVSAESAAYRDLAQAMVHELYEDAESRELTIPDNRDARRAYFEKRKKEVADASEAANAHLKHF